MFVDKVTFYGFSAAWRTVRLLPEDQAYRLFDMLADRAYRKRGTGVLQYEANLRRVLPNASPKERADVLRAGMRSYSRYWCDVFRMSDWDRKKIGTVAVDGQEHLDTVLATHTGAICVGSHSGNYDHVTAFVAQNIAPVAAVVERLKPEQLFQKFAAIRKANGIDILPTGTPNVLDVLSDRIATGHVIALMGDRDLSGKGIPVTFFGEEAHIPAGPALLAYRTNTPLLPVSFHYHGRNAAATVLPPIVVNTALPEGKAVGEATQRLAVALEDLVRAHPEDWHMLQPVWTADLSDKQKTRISNQRVPSTSP